MRKAKKNDGDERRRAAGGQSVIGLALLLLAAPSGADELSIRVPDLPEALRIPIESRLAFYELKSDTDLPEQRLRRIQETAGEEALKALRPYGYYHAELSGSELVKVDKGWRLVLHVEPGPPLLVTSATVELTGDGKSLPRLLRWQRRWPLQAGERLDQAVWEEQKRVALEAAEADGYLGAKFTEHVIEADLDRNEATTRLVLDTGPQAVIGSVSFEQESLKPGILELLPRFKTGQAYNAWLLEKFRLDVWRTGYFEEVDIVEERRLEESPPRVNLLVVAKERKRNTYQGSLGYGTDTEVRAQVLWNRHILSDRGDSLEMGLGWQQKNEEYSFKSAYRLPRRVQEREFWTADFGVRRENEEFKVKANDNAEEFIDLTNGNVVDYSIKLGQLKVRDLAEGYQQIFETWYGQYVLEKSTFNLLDLSENEEGISFLDEDLEDFRDVNSSFSIGVNWDWPVIRGSSFRTQGHHERAWIFTANEVWGSERDFTQAYLASTWHTILGRNFKLMLRGEVGYSDADVSEVQLAVGEQILQVSVTELPNLYRFKAGGSRSVRGYGFESLSNNGIGSNHIVTASAELEWRFREDWSVAAFFDAGNAFNDWDEANIKKGVGFGVRWYSIAGPVRVDLAQALDFEGEPWRIHFTVGTPLL